MPPQQSLSRNRTRSRFPKRFRLTPRCVVWDLSEVQAWLEKRRRTPVTAAKAPDVRLRRTRPVHDGLGAARPHL
nr:AlpA family phage regulatory protein [Brevundimonas naejangsanensis]